MFGRSSEKLDANQLDLFLMAPENEPGKVDASSLEEADPRHEPKAPARCSLSGAMAGGPAGCRGDHRSQGSAEGARGLALDRCGGQRTTRLRTRTVPAPAIGATQIRAARGTGSASLIAACRRACRSAALRRRTARADHRQQVLRSPCATSERRTDGAVIRATTRLMRAGPSEPADRSRLQIATGGCGQKPWS